MGLVLFNNNVLSLCYYIMNGKISMKRISLILLLLMSVSTVFGAIYTKRVSQVSRGNVFKYDMVDSATMYIIDGDCFLSGNVTLPRGSILKFEGGVIRGSGTIKASGLMIDAPKYQIFGENINFENDRDPQKGAIHMIVMR